MRHASFIGFFLISFLSLIHSEETVARAVKSDEPAPVKKGTPVSSEDHEAPVEKKPEPKKEDDFKVNLYEMHSKLRSNGGTPRVERRRYLNGQVLPTPKFSWKADETKPITKLVIKLGEQKVYGFQDALLVMESDISSGKEAYATKVGSYRVLQKNKNHKSNLFGSFVNAKGVIVNANAEVGQPVPQGLRYVPSSMPCYLRLTHEGLGLHAGILPGYPASHGCVRLPSLIAEKLFATVPLNTPVEIFP
jgi:lipoprotein-anchoring transpeptidase ErfK/SrfK